MSEYLTQAAKAAEWYVDEKIQKTLLALEKNGFKTYFAATRNDAVNIVLDLTPSNATVGVGGSITIRELGLLEKLVERGNTIIQTWGIKKDEMVITMKKQLISDVFLTSSNAITVDGKLINADAAGNRVASMIFGPGKVIVVVGYNKIVQDVTEGLHRIRAVASPMNAKRLKKDAPCTITGECLDEECSGAMRICKITTIIERKPSNTDLNVVIVKDKLGY